MEDTKINQEEKIISDKQVDEMYSELKGKKKSYGLISKFKGDVFSKIKKFKTDVKNTAPAIEKLKEKASSELTEVTEKSGSQLNNASKTLNEISKKSFDKTKNELSEGKAYLKQNAPIAGTKIKGELAKGAKSVRENAPKFGRKTKASLIDSIERIYGASTRGKQYGEKSIDLLIKIGELRDLGLITDEEFTLKKKEILDRI